MLFVSGGLILKVQTITWKMGEVKAITMQSINSMVETFANTQRKLPVEVVYGVPEGGSSAEVFTRRMQALADAKERTQSELSACASINRTTTRLFEELQQELVSLGDMEREVVLERCGEVERERDDAIRRARVEAARLQRTNARPTPKSDESHIRSEAQDTTNALLTHHHLDRVDRLGFGLDDRLLLRGMFMLKTWTEMATATIVYDSTVDPPAKGDFFETILYKENIAVVAFTGDGDVFGVFHNFSLSDQERVTEPRVFLFSLESHGRCMTPKQFLFECNDLLMNHQHYKDGQRFFLLCDGNRTYCYLGEPCFEDLLIEKLGLEKKSSPVDITSCFQGVDKTVLIGDGPDTTTFITRLVAIHLA